MSLVQNQLSRPLALSSGQVLAPGERGKSDPKDPHDKALEDEGQVLRIQSKEKKS